MGFNAVVSFLGFSLPIHPLSDVSRAMHDLHPVSLARSEEPNHLHVYDSYLLQVQNQLRSVFLDLVGQFPDVVRLKVTTQVNRGFSALRGLFDFHVPTTLIETSAICPFA
jgi:hypothetical protein